MNTSQRTVLIARGIYLYARYQNLTVMHDPGCDEAQEWLSWEARHPSAWVEFVKKEQFRLFDQVNGLL